MSNIIQDTDTNISIDNDLLKEKSEPKVIIKKDAKSIMKWLPWVGMLAMVVYTLFWPRKELGTEPPKNPVQKEVIADKLPLPRASEEVFVEEPATTEEINLVTDHADIRNLLERMTQMEEKLASVVKAVNKGSTGNGGFSESEIKRIARYQIEYYKRQEDKIAKSKGWKNYITWDQVNK